MASAFRLVALLLAVAVLAGCARTITGHPVAAEGVAKKPVDTSFIQGSDGGETDQLAAAAVLDLQDYWRQTFEETFAREWSGIGGGFFSVDTTDNPDAPPLPCGAQPSQVHGTAYYCPLGDAIVWDRSSLLPTLAERFGDAAVVIVLAHEMGHAVHHRLGFDRDFRQHYGQAYPKLVTEAMADCYAGAFVRWVTDGNAERLRIDRADLGLALGALLTFRDPASTPASRTTAHGNGFDRVSSFQAGYEHGPRHCASFSMDNREFTQPRFRSIAGQGNGNLSFDRLVSSIAPDLDTYFAGLVTQRGGQWRPVRLRPVRHTPDCAGNQGPVAYCPTTRTIAVDGSGELRRLHDAAGDYATGLLLASRYGLAALDALGKPIEGDGASRTALCLAGSYSGALLTREQGFDLAPGDLDEAVLMLLARDYGSRDARGRDESTGFERVAAFRAGTLHGVAACGS